MIMVNKWNLNTISHEAYFQVLELKHSVTELVSTQVRDNIIEHLWEDNA